MRNRFPRTQCRQAGCQQREGRQNHPGKSLYLHQAQQHKSCSQWFRRNRHKHYCILHGMWCILRLPGAVTDICHLNWDVPSHWLQQGNQQLVLWMSAKLAELLVRRWMEQIPEMKHWNYGRVLLESRVFTSHIFRNCISLDDLYWIAHICFLPDFSVSRFFSFVEG